MGILYLKAVHIIFIVTWFAGMFYIVRLFIYAAEADQKPLHERAVLLPQLLLMSRRLWYGITIPSAIITLILGPLLAWKSGYFADFSFHTWLHVKLGFVLLLYVYFYSLHHIFRQQQKGIFQRSPQFLRMWNEVATIFLVAIVMLAVVKSTMSWLWGLVVLVILVILLMTAIKLYKRYRTRKEEQDT